MKKELQFRLLYRLKQKNDVERNIQHLNKTLETHFEIRNIEKYWKDESLFACDLRMAIDGHTKEECVYNTLMVIKHISKTWQINGPYQDGNNHLIFEGVCNEDCESQPLKWGQFTLDLNEI